MRILDEENNKIIDSILLMLTPSEMEEMAGKIRNINPETGDHVHINDMDYIRQITILVYTPHNLEFFDEKVRKAIEGS